MDPQSLEDLPTEMICKIINDLPELSIEELAGYMTVSQKVNRIIRQCLRHINAQEKRIVPLEVFSGFTSLTNIGNNIILRVTSEDLHVLRTLPSLRSANFLLLLGVGQDLTATEILLRELNLSRKLPEVNFKIAYETDHFKVLFIQGDRYMIYPQHLYMSYPEYHQGLINMMAEQYPGLKYFRYELSMDNIQFRFFTLLNDRMRWFLIEGDFGLVDPSQPPGPNNPSLNAYTRILEESGAVKLDSLKQLFDLYIFNNQLLNPNEITKWNPDQLMRKLFRDSYVRFNYDMPRQDLFLADIPSVITANSSLTPTSFTEYSIPTSLDASTQQQIEQIVVLARQNKDALQNAIQQARRQGWAAAPAFYRTRNQIGPLREGFA